ncbi:hypothetical protein [Polynucleobacter wuianus]|uniref:hypothetical protein n=1 Tax=Polynucleobacter wuianus TaxID=1743168 RepID=UPI001C0BF8F6|nr:hypothetical protein [Polynucleobacter wuianus]
MSKKIVFVNDGAISAQMQKLPNSTNSNTKGATVPPMQKIPNPSPATSVPSNNSNIKTNNGS